MTVDAADLLRVVSTTVTIEKLLHQVAGLALLAAATIHATAVRAHFDHDVLYGWSFVGMALVQGVLGAVLILRPNRPTLVVAVGASLAIVASWAVTRTVGIAGLRVPAEPEPAGLVDGVATGMELLVVASLAAVVLWDGRVRRPTTRPATAAVGVLALGIVTLSLPAVAAAPRHGSGVHDHAEGSEQAADHHADTGHRAGMDADDHAAAGHGGEADDEAAGDDHAAGGDHASNAVDFGDTHAKEPCSATAEQQAAADKLVEDTKVGLARLADVEKAEAEGFMRFGDVAIQGTWHYINWKYQADPELLDPDEPESIVYWQATPDSPLILIGAMYVVPGADDVGPEIGGCLTRWHVHGEPFASAGSKTPEMLHVWLVPMPAGPFV